MYNSEINTNFYGNKIAEDGVCCPCLSLILLNSFVKVGKKYYPQILLEQCKYAVKKKNVINAINKELNLDESDDDEPDELDGKNDVD